MRKQGEGKADIMSNYKKYNGGINLWNSIVKSIPKTVIGAAIFARLIKSNDKTHYVFSTPGIGDAILALSYISEFKRQRNINHVTFVCRPGYVQRLCKYYPNAVDHVICLEKWELAALREFINSKLGQYYSGLCLDRVTFAFVTSNVFLRAVWDNSILDYPTYAKMVMYKISLSSKPERPQIPRVNITDIVSRYDLKKGKTVFINPTANSVRCEVSKLLIILASDLIAKGYRVVTLTAKDEELPIHGTHAIPCGLDLAFSLIEFGGILIGVRSGFMDVMVYANCKIISIEDIDYGYKSFYSLEKLEVNPDCHLVVYNGDDQVALQRITELVKQS